MLTRNERILNVFLFSSSQQKHLLTCRRVFQALMKISIEELIETADSLIAPVRMGVVRPTAPFAMSSSTIDVNTSSLNIKFHMVLIAFLFSEL